MVGLGWRAWQERARLGKVENVSLGLLAALALTPVIYFFAFNLRMWHDLGIGWPLMGRHYAGPLAAQIALLVWGLLNLAPQRWRPGVHLLLRAGTIAFNLLSLFGYLLPRYYL